MIRCEASATFTAAKPTTHADRFSYSATVSMISGITEASPAAPCSALALGLRPALLGELAVAADLHAGDIVMVRIKAA